MRNHDDMFLGAAPILFAYAERLRDNQTPAEELIWKRLSKKQVRNVRFKRQHPLKYFIADFYCHKARLVIEIDGEIHNLPEQFEYDIQRGYELKEHGITILRFTNEEVFSSIEDVIKQIEETIRELIVQQF